MNDREPLKVTTLVEFEIQSENRNGDTCLNKTENHYVIDYCEIWRVHEGTVYAGNVFDDVPTRESAIDIFAFFGTVGPSAGVLLQTGRAFFVPDNVWKRIHSY